MQIPEQFQSLRAGVDHCFPLPHSTSKTRGGEPTATAAGTCPLEGGKRLGETWQLWEHSENLLLPYRWLAPCSPPSSGRDPSVSWKPPRAPQPPPAPLAEKGAPLDATQPAGSLLGPAEGQAQREGPGLPRERPPPGLRGRGRAGAGGQAAGCYPRPRAGAEASRGRPGGRHLSGGGAAAMLGGGRGQRGHR